MRIGVVLPVLFAAVLFLGACGSSSSDSGGAPTLKWYIAPEGSGSFEAAAARCTKESGGKYKIELAALPADAGQQREQLVRRLAAKDSDIDLIGMDVIWTAEFAEAKWIEPFPADERSKIEQGTLKPALETATYKGKLYAAPLNTNTQLLWYRKDRVPNPPRTWEEMFAQAKKLGKDGGIEVQGGQFEALTVWYAALVGSGGGTIVKDDKATPSEAWLKALKIMSQQATGPWADPSLSNQREDENRLAWETGQPSFMINYSFVYPSAKENAPEVYKNMGWAQWPRVDANKPSRPTIGGFNIGVGAFGDHKALAQEAAACLREAPNQERAAIKGGLPPTLEALYKDPQVRKAFPFADDILAELTRATVRPVAPTYNDVSLAIQKTLSPPSGIDPPSTEKELTTRINDALQSKGLL